MVCERRHVTSKVEGEPLVLETAASSNGLLPLEDGLVDGEGEGDVTE